VWDLDTGLQWAGEALLLVLFSGLSVCVCLCVWKLQVINWCHVVRLCAVTKKLELIRFWWPWPLTLTTIFTFHASVTDRYWWHSVIGLFAYLCMPLLTQNISQTMTDARLDPGALICRTHWLLIGTVRFHLGWPWGVKNQGHAFLQEIYHERQQLRVGPNGDYTDFPWASLCMTLKGYKSRSQSFHSKYLENGDRYEVRPQVELFWN